MTIENENDSPFEDARENKEESGGGGGGEGEGAGEKKRKERAEGKKRDARDAARARARDDGDVPQTETHSPELCNSLLKQSHPGTLSSQGAPCLAATLPPLLTHQSRPREPARYNIKKEDGTRAPDTRGRVWGSEGEGGSGGGGGGGDGGSERVDGRTRTVDVEEAQKGRSARLE